MLLQNKNFLYLWSSQTFSQFAINIVNFLVIIKVYEETQSAVASSLVWIAYAIPVVIFGPLLATFVEMHDKRRMMLYSNLFQAVVIFIYALFFDKLFYFSFAVVMFYSIFDQVYVPAETASIPFLVKRSNLPRANGLFFLTAQAAAVLGFGLSGLVIKWLGFTGTLTLVGLMLVLAAIVVLQLPRLRPKSKSKYHGFKYKVREMFDKTLQGFALILRSKKILYPFLLLVFLQIYLVIFVVNLPALGKELIFTESAYVGIMTVLPIGAGALSGAYLVPKYLKSRRRKSSVVISSLLIASITMMLAPSVTLLMDFWFARAFVIFSFYIVGFCFVSIVIPSITFLQTHTPDQFMARVFGNFWFAAYLVTIIPTLFSASLTDLLGSRLMLVIMGFILFILYLYINIRKTKILEDL